MLEGGNIVGWFQGAAEFGTRALGNRSLLASPWAPYVQENLNQYVKHRQAFQPFAIAVTQEDRARYFDCSSLRELHGHPGESEAAFRESLDGFLLPGDRVRLHGVERSANPLLWRLLKRFGERAPAPCLVNTSFNLFGEPLVVTPREAELLLFRDRRDGDRWVYRGEVLGRSPCRKLARVGHPIEPVRGACMACECARLIGSASRSRMTPPDFQFRLRTSRFDNLNTLR